MAPGARSAHAMGAERVEREAETMLGYGQQPPRAPVAPSRLASRERGELSSAVSLEPKFLTTSRNADLPYGSLWKPNEAGGLVTQHTTHRNTPPADESYSEEACHPN